MKDPQGLDQEQRELIGDMLKSVIPAPPSEYVTHEELDIALRHIDTKIENAALKQKLWVLIGVVSILVSVFGSYASLMSRMDRLSEALPEIIQTQHDRSRWISRTEQRDGMQDDTLKKLDRSYQPLPYQEPPQ